MIQYRIDPTEVQYMGIAGQSFPCLWAVDTIVNSETPPERATLVTLETDRQKGQAEHLLLFWDWNSVPLTVVQSGFASGYPGTGPTCFSTALGMIEDRNIPTSEVFADKAEFDTIEGRRLTEDFIEYLRTRGGFQVQGGYILESHQGQLQGQTFWATRHQPRPNFDFLDAELAVVCRGLFENSPIAAVSEGSSCLRTVYANLLATRLRMMKFFRARNC